MELGTLDLVVYPKEKPEPEQRTDTPTSSNTPIGSTNRHSHSFDENIARPPASLDSPARPSDPIVSNAQSPTSSQSPPSVPELTAEEIASAKAAEKLEKARAGRRRKKLLRKEKL